MKKNIYAIFAMLLLGSLVVDVNAQMMRGFSNSAADWEEVVEHTTREEKEGKELWKKLQTKETQCADISDEDFAKLGEYFMGAMTGDSHAAMNAMMIQVHGEEGEEQIHVVMGKRLSGCDASAILPAGTGGWMPVMNMMTRAWSSPFSGARGGPFGFNSTQTMMNFGTWGTFGVFGLLFVILWWVLIIAAVVALVKWIANQFRGGGASNKSALDILKERYVKGEINKQEFEEKKSTLT